jgi:glycosyltransferase involved in cell wall biosynthesis
MADAPSAASTRAVVRDAKQNRPSRSAVPRRLRLIAIMDTRIVSGPGRQLAALSARLIALGHEVTIVLFQRANRDLTPYAAYLTEHNVPHVVLNERYFADPKVIVRLKKILIQERPDIVQTHGYKASCAVALLRLMGHRWPWVGCWHGATTEDRKVQVYHRLDRLALRLADRIVVMSAAQRELFAGLRFVSQIDNAVVDLPSGLTASSAAAERMRRRIGVLGRLSSEKGVDVFLQACSILQSRGVSFDAVIGGDGPERNKLEELARSLGVHHQVSFSGPISDVGAFYRSSDLIVLPSRSEGLPNVLLEAIASAVPVVATRVGEVPSVMTEEGLGLLVPPGRAELLAEAIQQILASFTPSAAARARVLKRYSLESRVARHLDVYHELLGAA